jgi:hypothetical protein
VLTSISMARHISINQSTYYGGYILLSTRMWNLSTYYKVLHPSAWLITLALVSTCPLVVFTVSVHIAYVLQGRTRQTPPMSYHLVDKRYYAVRIYRRENIYKPVCVGYVPVIKCRLAALASIITNRFTAPHVSTTRRPEL